MLVIEDQVAHRKPDDRGAVLVTVVVVMFVGFVIATMIAASVMFTIESNLSNGDRTQAFIAAESGRDVAIDSLRSAIDDDGVDCAAVALTGNSAVEPNYEYTIYTSDAETRPVASAAGWSNTCPTTTTKWVKVESTGWRVDSARTTVDAIYPWFHGPATQPAGTLAYFEGEFKATKSTYQGDLVIRDAGDYECNNGASGTIDGDLWVLNGGLRITDDCTVTGSVYTRGLIDVKNHKFTVGGDVISVDGGIKLNAGSVNIGGDVHVKGSIDTKNGSGVVNGSFLAGTTMVDHKPADWKRTDGSPVPALIGQPAPIISPTLDQVFDATSWIELTNSTAWGSATQPIETRTGVCTTAALRSVLEATGTRVVIDMTGCPSGGGIKVAPGTANLARDAVIYVPSTAVMDLELTGVIKAATGVTDPQLFIVHADSNGTDARPTCSTAGDKFAANPNVSVRTMIYSACGINKTMSLTMTGQLYMGNDGLHLNGGTFTCKPMSWQPVMSGLSCGVKGEGGIFDPSNTVTRLDNLDYQSEQ